MFGTGWVFGLRLSHGGSKIFPWQPPSADLSQRRSLKDTGREVRKKHNCASGNPVRFGDGCATVTGYKLPMPPQGKAGARSGLESGYRCGCARLGSTGNRLLRKEKDEAWPVTRCRRRSWSLLSSSCGKKAFLFSGRNIQRPTFNFQLSRRPCSGYLDVQC